MKEKEVEAFDVYDVFGVWRLGHAVATADGVCRVRI